MRNVQTIHTNCNQLPSGGSYPKISLKWSCLFTDIFRIPPLCCSGQHIIITQISSCCNTAMVRAADRFDRCVMSTAFPDQDTAIIHQAIITRLVSCSRGPLLFFQHYTTVPPTGANPMMVVDLIVLLTHVFTAEMAVINDAVSLHF